MSINLLLLLLTALANLAFAILVLSKNIRSRHHQFFSLFLGTIIVWMGCIFTINSFGSLALANVIGRIVWPVVFLIPVSFVFFISSFPSGGPDGDSRGINRHHYILLVLSAFMVLSSFFTDLIQKGTRFVNSTIRPDYGSMFLVFALLLLAVSMYALFLLFRTYCLAKNLIIKRQLLYIAIGFSFFGVVTIINYLVFPLLLKLKPIANLTVGSTLVSTYFMTYSILRYRFMDIQVILRHILTNALAVILSVGICSVLFYTIFLNSSLFYGPQRLLILLLIAFSALSVGLFISTRPIFQYVVDSLLFSGYLNYMKSLMEFGQRISTYIELDKLLQFLKSNLISTMGVRDCKICLYNQGKETWLIYPNHDGRLPMWPSTFKLLASSFKDIVVREELMYNLEGQNHIQEKMIGLMDKLEAEVLIPLRAHKSFMGFITLGRRLNRSPFSKEDIDFLSTISYQASICIHNAFLYEEVIQIKDYIESILLQMSSGVITVDRDGKITILNKSAEAILGLRAKEAVGRDISQVNSLIASILMDTLEGRPISSPQEFIYFQEDGKNIYLNISSSILRDSRNELLGAFCIFSDLTEMKQLEGEMRRAERLATVGTLAAGMAHEIKNPLVSLQTFAQLLPQKYEDPEFREGYSKIVVNEVERINTLVERLLQFARPTTPILQVIDLKECIEETVALLSTQINSNDISLSIHWLDEGPCLVYADKEQIKQVLINVLINSTHALSGERDKRIDIEISKIERLSLIDYQFPAMPENYSYTNLSWQILIQDNGPGISQEDLKHIFDPFFTTKEKGYGLGLAIAHNIISEHLGKIYAESNPGGGAKFFIHLPMVKELPSLQQEGNDEIRVSGIERP